MAKIQLAIDFGSKYITILKKGSDNILHERSVCIVSAANKRKMALLASGNETSDMIGRLYEDQKMIAPISGGVVIHKKGAEFLLGDFISRFRSSSILKDQIEVLACVSCGIANQEKKEYEDILYKLGVSDVTFIESPICVAQLNQKSPVCLVVDVGGEKTEIAIVNEQGIIAGCNIDIAGESFNRAIIKYVSQTHKLILQRFSTEKLKKAVGSLYDNDTSSATITGRSVIDNNPRSIKFTAKECKAALLPEIEQLCDVIEKVSLMVPHNLAESLYQGGILLVGGSSKINGFNEYLERRLHLKVQVIEEPEKAVILGAEQLMEDREKLGQYLKLSNFK